MSIKKLNTHRNSSHKNECHHLLVIAHMSLLLFLLKNTREDILKNDKTTLFQITWDPTDCMDKKFLILCFMLEKFSYRFGTTCGGDKLWVNHPFKVRFKCFLNNYIYDAYLSKHQKNLFRSL